MEVRIDRRRFLATSLAALAGIGLGGMLTSGQALAKTPVKLPSLPYALTGLEPYLTEETLDFHYGMHHAGYVKKLNKALAGQELEGSPLEDIIRTSGAKEELKGIFNNAAQIYNHTFYWNSMKHKGGGRPKGELAQRIDQDLGSYKEFRVAFLNSANSVFGSGWVWLIEEGGKLRLIQTSNADNPLARGLKPLLTIDLWEHAYYLDYQNRRGEYIDAFIDHLVNWEFAASNL
jgi:superoxide dismutase, Fe-Mn family